MFYKFLIKINSYVKVYIAKNLFNVEKKKIAQHINKVFI